MQGSRYYMLGGGGGVGGSDVCFCQSISWPADIWQCLCPSISWPALLTMCPSTSWLTHLTVFVLIHLMTVLLRITIDCLSSHLTNCRHIWQMCSSHDLQMLLTVFVSFHLMTCRHFWQCLCSSISWSADTFNSVCVHPSHDLRHFWQCLCPAISWPQTLLTVCLSISWPAHFWQFVFIHLMTCRHFWQCLCPSILWPADTFDNVCVHPSRDLQTLLIIYFLSIQLMTCRHFWQWFYVHPSHDIQTLFKVGLTVTW